ncbi:MAG: dihydrolipoyl dehydrogenase [Porphyromonas sp.]|nr:dihydrolipoyl dehydrogenase [Porphyromonas sp.]
MSETKYDLAVIGGGPGGYNAAAIAANNGLKTILFEKGNLGGVCLNEGCIPTKALLHSANLLDTMRESKKYGITVDGDLEPDYKRIQGRKNKIVRKLVAGVKMKLSNAGVEVVEALATLDGEGEESLRIKADDKIYLAKKVLLCTGSETAIPPIEGLAESGYWTSREALQAKELPKSLLIIGGGVIGMEFVSFFTSMGVEVTVVEMMSKILGPMDGELSSLLMEEYKKRGANFYLNTKVVAASKKGLTIETADGERKELKGERILLSAGRRAVTEGLGLETLNIEQNRGAVVVDQFMQSSHPRLYAAGDVTGYSLLAHTAIREGEVAVNHILGRNDDPMRYDAIPGVVYTHPEIASVGKTEEELKEAGVPHKVLSLPMSYAGRFVVENEGGNGLCKVIVDKDERVIGGHILGNPASELIIIIGMAITERLTVDQLKRHIFPHPTVGEIIHEIL